MLLKNFQWNSLKTRVALLTLLIFVVSISIVAFYASRVLREDMQTMLGEQQFSTVSGIAREIDDRLKDREQALQTIAKDLNPTIMGDSAALQTLLEQRPLLQLLFNGGVFITRTDGTAIADVPVSAGRIGTNYMDRDSVSLPLKEGRTVIGRPVLGKKLGAPIFSITAPIFDDKGQVNGVIAGTVNLGIPGFLDQIAQTRYGKSGGYLLLAPQHQLIVTASDRTRVMQPAPLPGLNAMHDRYVAGYEGFGIAVSSRGVEELSAAKGIPSAGWFIAATLPVQEAFAPIERMLQRMLVSSFVITMLVGALTWWLISRMLRQQFAPINAASRTLTVRSTADHPIQTIPISRDDEIGELIGSFNRLLETLAQREEILKKNEQHLAITLNSIGDAVIATDKEGDITGMNAAAERLTGWPLADALGRTLTDVFRIIDAKTRQTSVNPVELVMQRGEVVGLSNHTALLARDGREYQIADSASPIRDYAGQVVGVVLVFSDVTERYQAEEAIRAGERRFRSYFEQPLVGIAITSPKKGWLEVNKHLCKMLGFSKEEFTHLTWAEFTHPDDLAADLIQFERVLQGEIDGYALDKRFLRKDRSVIPVFLSVSCVREADGSVDYLIALLQDITERKQAEAALRESEQTFRTLASLAPVGIYLTSASGECLYANTHWRAMAGLSAKDSLGAGWLSALHPEDRDSFAANWQRMVDSDGALGYEYRFRTPQGSVTWVYGVAAPQRDDAGNITGYIGINLDTTERKRSSEQVERLLLEQKSILDSRIVGIAKLEERKYIWVNQALAEMLGYTPEEMVGQSSRIVSPSDEAHAAFSVSAMQVAMQGEVFRGETQFQRKDGSLCWFDVSGSVLVPGSKEFIFAYVDVTERKQAELSLIASEERWKFAIEGAGDGLWDWNIKTGKAFYSSRYKTMLGFAEEDIGDTGDEWSKRIHPDDAAGVFAALQPYLDGKPGPASAEFRMLCKDGSWMWTLGRGMVVERDANGKATRLIGTKSDITGRKLAEAKLQLAASVFDHAREGILITDAQGKIIDINDAFTRITNYSRAEAIGQNPRFLSSGRQDRVFYEALWHALAEQGHWSGEVWNRRKNGEVFAELLTISAVRDGRGKTQQYVALFSDITGIKEHQKQLEHIAHFDALTNLPNRLLLADRLQQAMAHALRRGQLVAVAYLDLDGFKGVNDKHGHQVGDQLLIHQATTMKETLREGDTLARLGGDEFVAVMIDLDGVESCVPMLTRLLEAAAATVHLGAVGLQGSASIGVTFYPQAHDIEADQLLRQADQAMYQAKLAGKNRFHVFDAAHDSNVRVHHESLERIRLALARGEFVLYYQPKVNMRSGQVVGVEALIRWRHPEKGLLAPAAFLPVIEDHPLAVEVGEWVIEEALTQLEMSQANGLNLTVSVNIGARQLQQSNFVARLQAILEKHPQVNPSNLELEVLETSALADIAQVSQVIETCHQMGVKFALDDFGTGYSSLTYLKRLRVALLKIDQSFVRDMLDDPDDLAILEGVISLAWAFKREVIAEGVETVEHGTALLHLGCTLAQGYGIARPMPAEQLPAWVATWRPDEAWCAAKNPGEGSHSTEA